MAQTVSSRIHSLGPAWGLRILPDCTKARPPGRSTRAQDPRVSARSRYRWMALVEASTSALRATSSGPITSSRSSSRRASFEVACQVLDRRIEVPVPAVVLDGVVPETEGVHGLLDPVLIGNAREAGGPLESPPRPARPLDGGGDGGVNAQEVGDGGGRAPAPAALGGDPEPGHEAVGHLH